MQITVNAIEGPRASVSGVTEYEVSVSLAGAQGPQGAPGATITAGPGFQIVGTELRYNLQSLSRG